MYIHYWIVPISVLWYPVPQFNPVYDGGFVLELKLVLFSLF